MEAFIRLQFVPAGPRSDDSTWYGKPMRLANVPPVILSECYGCRRIAEIGSGHDPEWQQNVDYWSD